MKTLFVTVALLGAVVSVTSLKSAFKGDLKNCLAESGYTKGTGQFKVDCKAGPPFSTKKQVQLRTAFSCILKAAEIVREIVTTDGSNNVVVVSPENVVNLVTSNHVQLVQKIVEEAKPQVENMPNQFLGSVKMMEILTTKHAKDVICHSLVYLTDD